MTQKTKDIPSVILFIMLVIGVYLLYLFVLFLAKAFVYLGFNAFFFTDNMVKMGNANPMVNWGILGFLAGSIIGVVVAIKKYKLSRFLVGYPVGITALFVITMILANKPADYSGSLKLIESQDNHRDTAVVPPKFFYTVTSDITVRSDASVLSKKAFVLKMGAEVEIIEKNVMDAKRLIWAKIQYNGDMGYIRMKYLKFSRTLP